MNRQALDKPASPRGMGHRAAAWGVGALLVAASLAACGGGGGDDDGPGSSPGGQRLAVGASTLVGDWLSRTCIPGGATRSSRLRLRVVQVGDNTVSYSQTFVRYASGDCSGAGTADGRSTALGIVTFSRSDANARAAANWGLWVLPNGLQSGAIWGKKGRDTALCIGATDRAFSGLGSLAAVSSWMDLSDASCYDKS
jgi:hypothetical protein